MDDEVEDQSKNEDKPEDENVAQLMEDHDIDEDKAEKVQELIDDGLDEDDAVEIADDL